MKSVWSLAVCAAMALWSGVAAADAVPPPPDDCPEGSTPNTCHGGPYCAPSTCTQDADCTGDDVCEERSLCLGSIGCAGGYYPEDAEAPMSPQITGACGSGATCEASSQCTPMKVCVAPGGGGAGSGAGTPGDTEKDQAVSGCSCRTAGAGGGLAVGLGLFVAGAAVFHARRQRPAQRRR